MANSKTYTWAEFNAGLKQLPVDVLQKSLPAMREAFMRESAQLEVLTEAQAYTPVAGTKSSAGKNTRSKNRMYGQNLRQTIARFSNKRNPERAYVVIGLRKVFGGGAIYGPMQLKGYRPGRPSGKQRQEVTGSKSERREALARFKRRIPGKNFFAKAYNAAGPMVQQRAMRAAIKEIDKVLARV